jgi:hypothetical protein
LKITRVRGGKSPRNPRDSVEELPNLLGRAWSHKRWRGEENRGPRVLRDIKPPLYTL